VCAVVFQVITAGSHFGSHGIKFLLQDLLRLCGVCVSSVTVCFLGP